MRRALFTLGLAVLGGVLGLAIAFGTVTAAVEARSTSVFHLTVKAYGVVLAQQDGPYEPLVGKMYRLGWSLYAAHFVAGFMTVLLIAILARRRKRPACGHRELA